MSTLRTAVFFALALAALPAGATVLEGSARVVDGDTLAIRGISVRLIGIDAPERAQSCERGGEAWACGVWAGEALRAMVGGREVACEGREQDPYGRLLATCRIGGRELNALLVREGAAVAYRRYSARYVAEEWQAQASGRGIWAGAVQAPEAFRRGAELRVAAAAREGDCRIKGNISGSGRIYHRPGQEHYAATRISIAEGERWFCSAREAEAAGWRAARR